jgi:hypothetical protein
MRVALSSSTLPTLSRPTLLRLKKDAQVFDAMSKEE